MGKTRRHRQQRKPESVPYDKVDLVDQALCQSPVNIGIPDMTSWYGNGVCVSGEVTG
jgi:hypothetical protein